MDATHVGQQHQSWTFGMASLVLGFAEFLPVPGIVASALALVFGYLSRSRGGVLRHPGLPAAGDSPLPTWQ